MTTKDKLKFFVYHLLYESDCRCRLEHTSAKSLVAAWTAPLLSISGQMFSHEEIKRIETTRMMKLGGEALY